MNLDLFYYLYPKHYRIIYDPNTGQMMITSFSHLKQGDDLTQRDADGYLVVKLNNKTIPIHRIAAEIVLGKCPAGLVVNHIDGDKKNNRAYNLEYVTVSENTKHAYHIGLHPTESHSGYIDGRSIGDKKPAYKKQWYEDNKEKVLQQRKKYYAENREKIKEYSKEYYKKNYGNK